MAVHFGALPGILFKPAETLDRLKAEANIGTGLKLYFVMMVLAIIVETMVMCVVYFSSETLRGISYFMYGDAWIAILIGIGLAGYVVNFIVFLLICGFTAKASASLTKQPTAFGGIVYMLSYVGAAFFLFIALPIALLGMFTGIGFFGPADIIKALVFGGMGWGTVVSLIITALVCVWELLVAGKAIALARGCTLGRGIFSVILGLGVTGAVMTAIVTLIVAVVRMSYY